MSSLHSLPPATSSSPSWPWFVQRSIWGVTGFFLLWFGIQSACVVGGNCRYDTDCPLNALCSDGQCRNLKDGGNQTQTCKNDNNCPNDQLCVNGLCAPISGLFENNSERPSEFNTTSPEQTQSELSFPPDSPGPETPSQDANPPDAGPAPLGKTPLHHAFCSSASLASSAKYRHVAILGQATPLVPASTVMRSQNYSARVGFVAVTLW